MRLMLQIRLFKAKPSTGPFVHSIFSTQLLRKCTVDAWVGFSGVDRESNGLEAEGSTGAQLMEVMLKPFEVLMTVIGTDRLCRDGSEKQQRG